MITWSATGHRPDKLGGYGPAQVAKVNRFARWYLEQHRPDHFVSGMAQGWDMACAAACATLGIPWTAAVPFPGQESKWPAASQEVYRRMLGMASEMVYVGKVYSPAAMQDRNEYMVRRADGIVALWDGSPGGTGNCVRSATRAAVPVLNLWPWWESFQ